MKLKFNNILLFAIILSSMTAFSQKGKVEEDPITGEKTCVFSNKYRTLRYEYKYGEEIDFYSTFNYLGEQNVLIPKGSELFIKLKDGSIIKLHSAVDAVPQTKVSQAGVRTDYTFLCKLSHDQVKTLAKSKIAFIRYPSTDGGTVDFKVKGLGKIYGNKITKGAIFISENL